MLLRSEGLRRDISEILVGGYLGEVDDSSGLDVSADVKLYVDMFRIGARVSGVYRT